MIKRHHYKIDDTKIGEKSIAKKHVVLSIDNSDNDLVLLEKVFGAIGITMDDVVVTNCAKILRTASHGAAQIEHVFNFGIGHKNLGIQHLPNRFENFDFENFRLHQLVRLSELENNKQLKSELWNYLKAQFL